VEGYHKKPDHKPIRKNQYDILMEVIILQEVYDFLKKCRTYYLATMEGDQPRVRPFGIVDMFEGRLYIQTNMKKNVSKQLCGNPKVEICAYDGDRWIRMQAVAVEDDRLMAKRHMLDTYPVLREKFSADEGNTKVFYLEDAAATISSFTGEPKVIRF
jgi:uncharacterized pyridoxamine 5'-phosphate oxidase family protein